VPHFSPLPSFPQRGGKTVRNGPLLGRLPRSSGARLSPSKRVKGLRVAGFLSSNTFISFLPQTLSSTRTQVPCPASRTCDLLVFFFFSPPPVDENRADFVLPFFRIKATTLFHPVTTLTKCAAYPPLLFFFLPLPGPGWPHSTRSHSIPPPVVQLQGCNRAFETS